MKFQYNPLQCLLRQWWRHPVQWHQGKASYSYLKQQQWKNKIDTTLKHCHNVCFLIEFSNFIKCKLHGLNVLDLKNIQVKSSHFSHQKAGRLFWETVWTSRTVDVFFVRLGFNILHLIKTCSSVYLPMSLFWQVSKNCMAKWIPSKSRPAIKRKFYHIRKQKN